MKEEERRNLEFVLQLLELGSEGLLRDVRALHRGRRRDGEPPDHGVELRIVALGGLSGFEARQLPRPPFLLLRHGRPPLTRHSNPRNRAEEGEIGRNGGEWEEAGRRGEEW